MYKVLANDVPKTYPPGYFPREYHYQKEAIAAAKMVVRRGASMARVECPDGSELDFRKENSNE